MTGTAVLSISALVVVTATTLPAQSPTKADALKLLGVDAEQAHTTAAVWNGKPTIFIDYPAKADDPSDARLAVYAVQRSNRRLTKVAVTTAKPEGGTAEIAAIGFANADGDPAKELIVILRWPQRHWDVNGDLFEVRLFDDVKPGATRLIPLTKLSKHFGVGCECWDRNARKPRHFKFRKVASIERELQRLGY